MSESGKTPEPIDTNGQPPSPETTKRDHDPKKGQEQPPPEPRRTQFHRPGGWGT